MGMKSLALAGALAMVQAGWAQAQVTQVPAVRPDEASLSLEEALARAEAVNPQLRARQAQLLAAQGVLTDAQALFQSNPQVTLEGTRRQVPAPAGGESVREWQGGVQQTFEIAGQPGFRREAARAAMQALQAEIADLRLQQQAEVSRRFYRVLALQRRVELETQAARLFEGTAGAVERRRAAGEDTRLDANVALVEWERARNQLAAVNEQLIEARSELAVPLQLPPERLPAVRGELTPAPLPFDESALQARVAGQPRLRALNARETSARARLRLEQAARTPDITLGVSAGREGPSAARERLTTFSVSVPIPLFRRNATAIGQASADAAQAEVERIAAERDLPAQVHALWLRLESLRQRIQRLETSVLPTLSRNDELSRRSLQAGQIGLLELLVANRQMLDARRDLIEAYLEYHNTRLTLEAAAGWPVQP